MALIDSIDRPKGFESPAYNAAAITPDDNADLAGGYVTRALYIGGAGDVKVKMRGIGAAVIFKAVPLGQILPIAVERVLATGTTATQIIALW